jgi:hypothetical protein
MTCSVRAHSCFSGAAATPRWCHANLIAHISIPRLHLNFESPACSCSCNTRSGSCTGVNTRAAVAAASPCSRILLQDPRNCGCEIG